MHNTLNTCTRPPIDCRLGSQWAALFVYVGLPQLHLGVAAIQPKLVAYTQLAWLVTTMKSMAATKK
jgi:hypothetical protein